MTALNMSDAFKVAHARYNDGSALTDADLNVLHDHYYSLSLLVKINPDLECLKLYVYTHLNRVNDYIRARKEK